MSFPVNLKLLSMLKRGWQMLKSGVIIAIIPQRYNTEVTPWTESDRIESKNLLVVLNHGSMNTMNQQQYRPQMQGNQWNNMQNPW